MSYFRKKNSLIRDIGGVALADILANGVVVLLVVIIITISLKKQQTEQQIEQSVEISAILARDIASSLVFNDLPSSPPATLHNYLCRAPRGPWRNYYEQHDCMPWLYPIVEFHKGYIREYNTKRIFTRAELLTEDNALDLYMELLSLVEKQRVRVDIYDLDLYYLGLAILKEHGLRPSHWHFWGEGKKVPQEETIADFVRDPAEDTGNGSLTADEGDATLEGTGEGEQATEEQQEEVPADASLRSPGLVEDMLPPSDALSRLGRQESSAQGFGTEEPLLYSDFITEALTDALLEEENPRSAVFGSPAGLRLRIPSGYAEDGESNLIQLPPQFFQSESGQPVDYHLFMITLLLDYLEQVEALGFDRVSMDALFARFLSGQVDLATHPHLAFAQELKEKMRAAFAKRDGLFLIQHQECKNCQTELLVPPNHPVERLKLHSLQGGDLEETSYVNVQVRLYPYPGSGQFTEIYQGDTLLVHPQSIMKGGKRWYVVGILDPNIEDVVIGYVYGNDQYDVLGLQADVNNLRLSERRLFTLFPLFPLREEIILGIVYGGLALLIILVFFFPLSVFFARTGYGKESKNA